MFAILGIINYVLNFSVFSAFDFMIEKKGFFILKGKLEFRTSRNSDTKGIAGLSLKFNQILKLLEKIEMF